MVNGLWLNAPGFWPRGAGPAPEPGVRHPSSGPSAGLGSRAGIAFFLQHFLHQMLVLEALDVLGVLKGVGCGATGGLGIDLSGTGGAWVFSLELLGM